VVIEVARPNRQVRRQHGKTAVVDATAAGRVVLSGQASATPKAVDGPVERLRALEVVQRSAKQGPHPSPQSAPRARRDRPAELRERLRHLNSKDLVTTCAAFR
jgi:transposase